LAGVRDSADDATAATAATAGDDERRVTETDDERATTTATSFTRGTCAADGDLQALPGGQAKIAADLGASAAGANTVSALRAKGEDLIVVGGRHREGDETAGIREVEWHGAGGRPRHDEPQKRCPSQQNQLHFVLPDGA
jgi:hypothetical protein